MSRTMREIAARYDAERNKIVARINSGERSASMSGIEYYPKPWADLDMSNECDAQTVRVMLDCDGRPPMTDIDELIGQMDVDADEIAGWGAGNEAATMRRAATALAAQKVEIERLTNEYICKCGQRVEPHRCADGSGGF